MNIQTPPPLAERLLRMSVIHEDRRDAISGDLREEFATACRRKGIDAARRWYWGQAIRMSARFAAVRFVPSVVAKRWDPSIASDEAAASAGWLSEFRHALRAVKQRPALSGMIVTTLALALAANATIFNLTDAIYLRPFRFPGVDRLVVVASVPDNDPFANRSSVAPADYRDWQRDSKTLTDFAAAQFWDPNLSDIDQPEQLNGFMVTPSFFKTLGVQPLYGHVFSNDAAVPGRDHQVLLSHALWLSKFGGEQSVIGKSVRLNREAYEVIGIMPSWVKEPFGAQVWAPLALGEKEWADRKVSNLLTLARLRDGETLKSAFAEMRAIVARLRHDYPDTNAKRELSVATYTTAMEDGGAGAFLKLWVVAAFLLLLIASANIANALLSRGTERRQEFALRLALGAGRGRLAMQLMIEGAWLALLAIALSIPLTYAGIFTTSHALPPMILRWVPGYEFIRVDFAALALTGGLALVSMLLFSVLPALHASGANVSETLRQGARSIVSLPDRNWIRAGLATLQVALSVALIAAATLIVNAVNDAIDGPVGFDKHQVMAAAFALPDGPYKDDEHRRQFTANVLDRLKSIPAVESVAMANQIPYAGGGGTRPLYPEGVTIQPADVKTVDHRQVTPAFFEVMRIPLVSGRTFNDNDRADAKQVAVVSQKLADQYWPGADPVGRRFKLGEKGQWIEVVGVTGDVAQDWLLRQRNPTVYRPVSQSTPFSAVFVARTVTNPLDIGGEMRRAVLAVDPDQPLIMLATMEHVVEMRVAGVQYLARALAVMSGIALILAVTGVYSLMSYLTSRRTQEIGVRIALGATRWEVIRLAISHAMGITAAGASLGAVLAYGTGLAMQSALFGLVKPSVMTLATVVVGLSLAAVMAAYLPARRAARLDPTVALRNY